MRTCFFPVGNKNRASSRYRVHWIVPERHNFYIAKKGNWKEADALVFQRVYRRPRTAEAAREMGKLVCFDQTDFWWYWNLFGKADAIAAMAKRAHFLTTSTEDDAKDMRELLGKRVYVIPNAQKKSSHIRKHGDVDVPTICWIGRELRMVETLGSTWPILHRLALGRFRFRLLIINDTGSILGPPLPFTEVLSRSWKLKEIYPTISRCDIGICPQEILPDGKYHKDKNTKITFWMCGVPCVASGETEDWYGDLRKLLLDWKERERQGIEGFKMAQAFTPDKVVRKWVDVLEHERRRL